MPLELLDYPKAKVLLRAETDVERSYRVHACAKEPWTVDFIERMEPGSIFWDVGACVGSYTLLAARLGHAVIAIEPHYANYARLCENLALNDLLSGPVFVLCGAIGAQVGFDTLAYADLQPGSANHDLGGQTGYAFHRQRVMVQTLDNLRTIEPPGRPRYLKIDVDGGEVGVLLGAGAFLADEDLRGVLIEMADEHEAECTRLLEAAGWALAERHAPRAKVSYGLFRRG